MLNFVRIIVPFLAILCFNDSCATAQFGFPWEWGMVGTVPSSNKFRNYFYDLCEEIYMDSLKKDIKTNVHINAKLLMFSIACTPYWFIDKDNPRPPHTMSTTTPQTVHTDTICYNNCKWDAKLVVSLESSIGKLPMVAYGSCLSPLCHIPIKNTLESCRCVVRGYNYHGIPQSQDMVIPSFCDCKIKCKPSSAIECGKTSDCVQEITEKNNNVYSFTNLANVICSCYEEKQYNVYASVCVCQSF